MLKHLIAYSLLFLLIASIGFADKIPSPPRIDDLVIRDYFQKIYDNLHRLEVVTTNPDGSRNGKKGDMLLLNSGEIYYLEINTNSGTVWSGIQLQNLP